MPNTFVPIGKGSSFDEALPVINTNFAQLDKEAVTKVFKQASGNAVVQGKLPGDIGHGFLMYDPAGLVSIACYVDAAGQPVLKIAKDGFDALTATNDQLILNSAQNVFKIVGTGEAHIEAYSANTGGANYGFFQSPTVTITHNLGFTPAIIAYVNNGGNYILLPWTFPNGTSSTSFALTEVRVGTTSSTATFLSTTLALNRADTITGFSIKYYLLQETAN